MAKKKTPKKSHQKSSDAKHTSEPKFPYTTAPGSLRGFLKAVPNKPRPPKVSQSLLQSWGFGDNNSYSMIRVLKEVGLLDGSGVPTDAYTAFMQPAIGPATLGAGVRRVYEPLFQASREPYRESDDELRRLFNIHSGGSTRTLLFQIQTFKALSDFATFDGLPHSTSANVVTGQTAVATTNGDVPSVHIDLHIHLPENKSVRDYQAIIEDIARYIYRYEGAAGE